MPHRKLNAIIIGCSSMGAYIATELSSIGENVTVFDRKKVAFKKLGEAFSGFTYEGDATDTTFLSNHNIKESDVVIIATEDDNVNSFIALYLKKILKLPIVITRIYDEEKKIIFENSGVKLINPATLVAKEFFNILNDAQIENEIALEKEKSR